jgi:hypothetical protein
MDDLRIPCLLWFPGDPPPDLSGFAEPIRLPVRVVWRADAAAEQPVPTEPPPQAQPPEPPGNDLPANTDPGEPMSSRIGNAILRLIVPAAQAQTLAPVAETRELTGFATFYNQPGNRTASGRTFDPNGLTAAMTSDRAKIGDKVRVQLQSDPSRSVDVIINDTGPFERRPDGMVIRPLRPDPKIVIDLTPHAFDVLTGDKRALGKVQVIVTVMGHAERSPR